MDEFVFLSRVWVQEQARKIERVNRNAWMVQGAGFTLRQRRRFLESRRG